MNNQPTINESTHADLIQKIIWNELEKQGVKEFGVLEAVAKELDEYTQARIKEVTESLGVEENEATITGVVWGILWAAENEIKYNKTTKKDIFKLADKALKGLKITSKTRKKCLRCGKTKMARRCIDGKHFYPLKNHKWK